MVLMSFPPLLSRIFNISTGKQKKLYKGSVSEDGSLLKVTSRFIPPLPLIGHWKPFTPTLSFLKWKNGFVLKCLVEQADVGQSV